MGLSGIRSHGVFLSLFFFLHYRWLLRSVFVTPSGCATDIGYPHPRELARQGPQDLGFQEEDVLSPIATRDAQPENAFSNFERFGVDGQLLPDDSRPFDHYLPTGHLLV